MSKNSVLSNHKNADRHPARFKALRYMLLVTVSVVLLGLLVVFLAWKRYQNIAKTEAMTLARSVVSLLHAEHIQEFTGTEQDTESPDYQMVKRSLSHLTETNKQIRFAYILGLREGEILFLLDSEQETSPEYSPPGQIYTEAKPEDIQPFLTGEPIITGPTEDRWGTWYSAMIPIMDIENESVIAVLGLDYAAAEWDQRVLIRMMPNVVTTISLCSICLGFAWIWRKHKSLKVRTAIVSQEEALFHGVFDQAPIGIAIVKDKSFTYRSELGAVMMNTMYEQILGRTGAELEHLQWTQITHPDDLEADVQLFKQFLAGEIDGYKLEKRFIKPDGSFVWTNMIIASIVEAGQGRTLHLCLLEDITARKAIEKELKESERKKAVLLAHLPGMAYRSAYDRNWTMHYVSDGCKELTGYMPEQLIENRDLSFNDLIAVEYRDLLWLAWIDVLHERKYFHYEYEIITSNHTRKWVMELGQGIYDAEGRVEALEGIIVDISELKRRETQIKYLNQHDFLTGLFNRKFFEETLQRLEKEKILPVSIMMCDINGLKMINNIFGSLEGDRVIIDVAHLIQNCCGEQDVLCRTGGDEFTIIMPYADQERTQEIYQQIEHMMESYYRAGERVNYEISISIGYGVKERNEQALKETVKTAEEYLMHRKLLNQQSSHNSVLSSVMATLYARSNETEEHGRRLAQLTKMIGEQIGLGQGALDDLELLSMLHDIGKVGIDDRILKKPGQLTSDEWVQMKKHSEIGYRIAMATPELQHIAGLILRHHERWDGSGYPGGLKGLDIPLASRILSIADAFDAMTENRIYREALSKEAAIVELQACAGTQFDPELTEVFVNLMS